jgi:hypothetical protein
MLAWYDMSRVSVGLTHKEVLCRELNSTLKRVL